MLTLLGFIAFSIIPFGLGVLVGMLVGLPRELEERELMDSEQINREVDSVLEGSEEE